jgi:hypothetical protein
MKGIVLYKIGALWCGVIGLILSQEHESWGAFGAFSLLALTALVLKDANTPIDTKDTGTK